MLRNFVHHFVAATMALVLLVSTVGIAEVSHLCKMSINGGESQPCEDLNQNNHPCCENSTADCCSDEVKIYQGSLTLILKESIGLAAFFLPTENVHSIHDVISVDGYENFRIVTPPYLPGSDGNSIVVSKRSFLI